MLWLILTFYTGVFCGVLVVGLGRMGKDEPPQLLQSRADG